ncbi:Gfo/Idh/MocA family oxidoreductase [Ruegeria sp. 2205SS24-7]|uniref:Gfo/Idh/MocA family protein n=1 Tax=Ruegeria discodermiae TaxID=3064389 RepID=UPI0027422958|nr:Gfo/Idh/MocA family oxidoreductase [Ruegeria sp. 2205SS24-7]MDP5217328.1 Gfo/Idh/MocA family oxidoreductase [Ruegeria sp. 2205SS24-7]
MEHMGVGIIGAGNISAAYLRLAPLFRGFAIRAIADLDMEAAAARAAEFGIRAETVDTLLAADDVDVVVNLTIPAAHFEVTKAILKAGKHAYSEKPVVLTKSEGEALSALAAEHNLRVGSAPDTFLGGSHQQARHLLDDGAIGRVVSGTAYVMGPGMEHWHPNPDFFFLPGAGPVLDIGPYYITNLINLLGPVRQVAALSQTAFSERTITSEPRRGETVPVKTPTTLMALLEFESGAVITLGASWDVKAHAHSNMELYGSHGSLLVPDPNFFGGALSMAGEDGQFQSIDPWDHPFGVPNEGVEGTDPRANYRCAGLADMIASLQSDTPHRCALELAVHSVDVMTAILQSAESGEFVNMTTTCQRPAPLPPELASRILESERHSASSV